MIRVRVSRKNHSQQLKSCFGNDYITIIGISSILGIGSELLDSFPEDIFDIDSERKDIILDLTGEDTDIWVEDQTLFVESESVRIKLEGISDIRAKIGRLVRSPRKTII